MKIIRNDRINEGILNKLKRVFKPLGRNDRDMGRDAEWSKLAIKKGLTGGPNYRVKEDDLGWYYDPYNEREKYFTFDEDDNDEDILDDVRVHDNDYGIIRNIFDRGKKIKDCTPEQLKDIEDSMKKCGDEFKDLFYQHYNDDMNLKDKPMDWSDYDNAERIRDGKLSESINITEKQLHNMINESIRRNLKKMIR